MKRCFIAVFLLVAAVAGGCKPSAPPPPAARTVPALPTQAQPRLATIKLYLGPKEMTAEMAVTEMQERTGMMFRTNMAENDGMIFVLPRAERANFWMMNCVLPLSAAYIDPDGMILEIHDLQPGNTNGVVAATDNILYVLETPQGWFSKNGVAAGAVIRTDKGSLRKTFFGTE
jgi:uncharacterized membrane protein (UPF0127 family)